MYVDGGFPVRTAVGRSVRYRSEVLKERERETAGRLLRLTCAFHPFLPLAECLLSTHFGHKG